MRETLEFRNLFKISFTAFYLLELKKTLYVHMECDIHAMDGVMGFGLS